MDRRRGDIAFSVVFVVFNLLSICLQEYEDLDEILARFVQPMAASARDLMSNKNYHEADGGERSVLESLLKSKKESNPKLIPYIISPSKQYPGRFVLAYQPSSKSKFEFVTVVPSGYRYRCQVHGTVQALIQWFKEHFREPIRIPHPTQTPTASMHGTPIPVRLPQHGQTPYTPSQWTHHTPTPSPTPSLTPHYGHQQQPQAYYYHQPHYAN